MPDVLLPTVDWTALPAGRELDALVAEHVLGWRVIAREAGRTTLFRHPRWDSSTLSHQHSRYLTAAWEVVEEMERLGYRVVLRTPFDVAPVDSELRNHHAVFIPHGMSEQYGAPEYGRSGETMPLAICRAALAAAEEIRAKRAQHGGHHG